MDSFCSLSGCAKPSAATLADQTYCREHFILSSYERLETCVDELRRRDQRNEVWAEARRRLLNEIVDQAAAMAMTASDLSNLERSRLLDIVLWASKLVVQLRCDPRRCVSIPVRLYFRSASQTYSEETVTLEVSQHGTSLRCGFPIQVGNPLVVERMDTSEQVDAVVKWRDRRERGVQRLGIEILNCDNFWGLDW